MYRVQAIMVMVMAVISLLGFFLVPSKGSSRQLGLEPASSVQSSPNYSADLNQKRRVRDLLLSNSNITSASSQHIKLTDEIAFVVEEENRMAWIVALGDLNASRFRRWETLRIWKSGRIDEQNDEGHWRTLPTDK